MAKFRNIDFDRIIKVVRHEFDKVRADEVVKANIGKLDYLEGFILGMVKLMRTELEDYLNRYDNKRS